LLVNKLPVRLRRGVFYGWWVIAAGFVIQMVNGSLFFHSFGAYFVYLEEGFGWSKTMLSGAYSLARMESGILGPIQGWFVDRFGPRALVRVGSVIFGVGLMLFSQIQSEWQFYGAFLVMALGSSFAGFMAVSATVANWFMRRRSRAMGIAMAGMGVGGLLVPLVAWCLGHYGWRPTAFVSGLIVLVVGVAAAQLLRHRPEEYGYLPDGATAESRKGDIAIPAGSGRTPAEGGAVDLSFTALEALKTRSFWLLSLAHGGALLVVSSVSVHLIPHIVERLEFSVEMGATMVSLMMVMNIFGQVFGGALGDRINKRVGLTLCLLGHSGALFVLAFSSTIWQVALFAVIHGLSWGTRGPLVMSIRADYFGRASYATIMGFSSLIMMLGMIAGPLFAGNLADRLGDYKLAFAIVAGVAGLSSVLFLAARRPKLPSRLQDEVRLRS